MSFSSLSMFSPSSHWLLPLVCDPRNYSHGGRQYYSSRHFMSGSLFWRQFPFFNKQSSLSLRWFLADARPVRSFSAPLRVFFLARPFESCVIEVNFFLAMVNDLSTSRDQLTFMWIRGWLHWATLWPPVSVTRWKSKSSWDPVQVSAGSWERFSSGGDKRGAVFTWWGRQRGCLRKVSGEWGSGIPGQSFQ